MKAKTKKNISILSKILLIIIIPIAVFGVTYEFYMYKSYSSYKATIVSYVNSINNVNKSITSCENKDKSINIEKSKTELTFKIEALMKIKGDLSSINPCGSYSKSHNNLISGLEANIHMYKLILNSTNNTEDTQDTINNVENYRKNCMKYYSDINIKGIDLALPKETYVYINNFLAYKGDQLKLSKAKDSKQTQHLNFINTMETIVNKYLSIKTDFSPILSNIQAGSGSYEDMISKIEQNTSQFAEINTLFSKLQPNANDSEAINSYRALKKVLVDYNLYLDSIRSSVTNEKFSYSTGVPSDEILNTIYSVPNENLSNLDTDFEEFSKIFSSYKQDSWLQVEFVFDPGVN